MIGIRPGNFPVNLVDLQPRPLGGRPAQNLKMHSVTHNSRDFGKANYVQLHVKIVCSLLNQGLMNLLQISKARTAIDESLGHLKHKWEISEWGNLKQPC